MNFCRKVSTNYGIEIDVLSKDKRLSEGINFFDVKLDWDNSPKDNNPQFNFHVKLLNIVIFAFCVYNVWDISEKCSPFYKEYHHHLQSHQK